MDAWLDADVDSPNTARAYRRHVTAALDELGVFSVADVNGAQLAAYRAAVTRSGRAPASQGQALAALRSFLKWSSQMQAHGLTAEVIAVALRTPHGETQRP